jgi:hypothetical protein
MSALSEELFNNIMLYVSHPCADMINNCKMTRFDNVKIMKTNIKIVPNTKIWTAGVFDISDDTSEKFEKQYELNVVEQIYIINLK